MTRLALPQWRCVSKPTSEEPLTEMSDRPTCAEAWVQKNCHCMRPQNLFSVIWVWRTANRCCGLEELNLYCGVEAGAAAKVFFFFFL